MNTLNPVINPNVIYDDIHAVHTSMQQGNFVYGICVCAFVFIYIYICRCSVDVKYEYDGWAPVEVRHL